MQIRATFLTRIINLTLIYANLNSIAIWKENYGSVFEKDFDKAWLRESWLSRNIVEFFYYLILSVTECSLVLMCLIQARSFVWKIYDSDHSLNCILLYFLEGTDSRKQLLFSEHENKEILGNTAFNCGKQKQIPDIEVKNYTKFPWINSYITISKISSL